MEWTRTPVSVPRVTRARTVSTTSTPVTLHRVSTMLRVLIRRQILSVTVLSASPGHVVRLVIVAVLANTGRLANAVWCWPSVVDDGPTSKQHWLNVPCLLDTVLPCKDKRQYPLTCIVSRYCLLALHDSVGYPAFILCWFNVGPASQTVAQHWTSTCRMCRVYLDGWLSSQNVLFISCGSNWSVVH